MAEFDRGTLDDVADVVVIDDVDDVVVVDDDVDDATLLVEVTFDVAAYVVPSVCGAREIDTY